MPRITAPSGSILSVAAGLAGAALVVALLSGAASTRFQHNLDQSTPPLSQRPAFTAAADDAAPARRLSRRVVLVILDGLRDDASHGQPFLDSLRARGASASARAAFPSLSLPGYTSILTGAPPRWSGVRSNSYDRAVPLVGTGASQSATVSFAGPGAHKLKWVVTGAPGAKYTVALSGGTDAWSQDFVLKGGRDAGLKSFRVK